MICVEGTASELPQRTKKRGRQRGLKDMKESDLRLYNHPSPLASPQSPPVSPWPLPSIVASPWHNCMRSSEPRMMMTTWPGLPSIALTISSMSHMCLLLLVLLLCLPFRPSLLPHPTHQHLPCLIRVSTPSPATTTLISTRTLMSITSPSRSIYHAQHSIHPRLPR